MNKKISTLMASLLFASAFTANAAVYEPVEGDNVRLKFNSKYATIDTENGFIASNSSATEPAASTTGGNFEAVNRQIWKIAKLSKSSTGQELYQFVNKWTGEYLAIKLVSAPNVKAGKGEASESASEVKLDPTGNKEWAFDGANLWAYDAVNDTTYYINSQMKLVAKPGNDHRLTTAFAIEGIPTLSMPLNAKAFNQLMKLPGNNAKLNFNNGKDVTSTQTNQLKNVKWVADENGTGALYLTNGSTTKGSKVTNGEDGIAWSEIQKKMYLQVDTAYYDEKTPNYFKFDVDTINYELKDDDYSGKPIAKHPKELAQFAATYYFGNDSIAISAKYLPKKAVSAATGSRPTDQYGNFNGTTFTPWASTGQTAIETAFDKAAANIDKSIAISKAITNLAAVINSWIPTSTTAGEPVPYASTELTALTNAFNMAADYVVPEAAATYKDKVTSLKYTKAYYFDGTASETAPSYTFDTDGNEKAAFNLKAGVTAWLAGSSDANFQSKFVDTYFTFTNIGTASASATIVPEGTASARSGRTLLELEKDDATDNNTGLYAKLDVLEYHADEYSYTVGDEPITAKTLSALSLNTVPTATYFTDAAAAALFNLESAFVVYQTNASTKTTDALYKFAEEKFSTSAPIKLDAANGKTVVENGGFIKTLETANTGINDAVLAGLITNMTQLAYLPAKNAGTTTAPYFWMQDTRTFGKTDGTASYPVVLRSLADVTVLTVAADGATIEKPNGYVLPLIQPYATSGGDATDIVGGAKIYNLQVKDASTLRAASTVNKYVISVPSGATGETSWAADVDASNVYAQWVFIPGTSGFYSIVNRATEQVLYTGPVSKVKDADDKVVADTYVLGSDTLKLASVELSSANVYEEGDNKVKYDYTGTYYAGTGEGTAVYKSFVINPVSPFLSQLAAQFNKDSVMVLGDADDAPVWYMEKGDAAPYGVKIEGLPRLKKQLYRIYTTNADDKKIYVYATNNPDADNVYAVSLVGSINVPAAANAAQFEFRNIAEGQYQFINGTKKMTINATPSQPILEVSAIATQKNDLFMINKSEVEKYRKLTAEDGVLGNAKIYMENEPNRYLYENTANIVANNGTGLNFLGIYNTAELTKNAALYVDTAFVERKDVYMPQYMFALGVTEVPAEDAVACTYEHNHYDNAGNKVDAAHCSHATPATMGYKSGRYLVALTDSLPENGSKKTPVLYDNAIRLAFVNAIHRAEEDSLIIKDSKWTDNNKQIVAGKEKTYASNDTLKIEDNKLNMATFALLIKDQETKSFYLQNKEGFVRILNGVPVLTDDITDAAVFNIEATTEEATANEAIETSQVTVIGGQGAVTVQGAAGKVITVADILGRTIANQVAASDNVTIAAPAGVVVVAVDGEATKVVVK